MTNSRMSRLPLKFAVRYLFARKSYHVINMISGIGVAGMAIGTAALVVILSVFNGFIDLVSNSLGDINPDIVVRPAAGKVFVPTLDDFGQLLDDDRVVRLSGVLEEQVFLSYEGRQSLARVKGLDEAGEEESRLQEHVVDGYWLLHRGQKPMAVGGLGIVHSLGANPRFVTPIEMHYPSRTEAVSLANPAASLRSVKVQLAGTFSVNADADAKLMVVPIETLRELLDYEEEVSALEIWTLPGQTAAVQKELQTMVGERFKVLDRYQQDESLFRMMRYEKLAIYLILIFVVLIIAFNIYSSLKMLIIEKQEDRYTLRSLGAPDSMVRRIFLLEGWLVSLLGLVIGLVIGIILVLLQQRYGLVAMPGNFAITAYPVVLRATDLICIAAGVALIGYLMALLPSRKL